MMLIGGKLHYGSAFWCLQVNRSPSYNPTRNMLYLTCNACFEGRTETVGVHAICLFGSNRFFACWDQTTEECKMDYIAGYEAFPVVKIQGMMRTSTLVGLTTSW